MNDHQKLNTDVDITNFIEGRLGKWIIARSLKRDANTLGMVRIFPVVGKNFNASLNSSWLQPSGLYLLLFNHYVKNIAEMSSLRQMSLFPLV
jgi:hypothetical protein